MKKKILVPLVAMAMMASAMVGGTLAYLSDKTDKVVNTFTVGNVGITLAETTTDFKMVPGVEIAKDPVVTVEADSEDCYLFVEVKKSENLDNYIAWEEDSNWTETAVTIKDGGKLYVYNDVVVTSGQDQKFHFLKNDKVKTLETVEKNMMDAIQQNPNSAPTLTFAAYAVQAAGFDTPMAAWNATFGKPEVQ